MVDSFKNRLFSKLAFFEKKSNRAFTLVLRNLVFFLSSFCPLSATTYLTDATTQTDTYEKISPPYFEVKAGYFFFASHSMRKVYNQGGFDIQVSGAYPMNDYYRIYASAEYLEKSGHSEHAGQKTSFWAIPFSLGLQPVFKLLKSYPLSYYFTIGPRYYLTKAHNQSSFVSSNIHANGFGGFFNTGFMTKLKKDLFIDLFGELSYAYLRYSSSVKNSEGHKAQVGGLTFGLGLVYTF
jgi:hypothetical protein